MIKKTREHRRKGENTDRNQLRETEGEKSMKETRRGQSESKEINRRWLGEEEAANHSGRKQEGSFLHAGQVAQMSLRVDG